jgi:uncharacterized membrane protein YhaH (DUF805 family)
MIPEGSGGAGVIAGRRHAPSGRPNPKRRNEGDMDVNKLWQNFLDNIQNHYADFSGRVGRPQFWYYMLAAFVIGIVVEIIAGVTTHLVSTIYTLGMLAPNFGMIARRLQDTGKPGSWAFLLALPIVLMVLLGLFAAIGGLIGLFAFILVFSSIISLLSLAAVIAIIYLCAQPGTPGPNEYGVVPPVFSPN